MYEITLTPAATLGLFLAHRRHKSDTVPGLRASIDAERWFLGKDPLVENKVVDVPKTPENPEGKGATLQSTFNAERTVRAENEVYDHLKAAIAAGISAKLFERAPGAPSPEMGVEAHDAVEKAQKIEISKDAPASPKVLEGGKKKSASA